MTDPNFKVFPIVICGAFILLVPTILNGGPIFYFDTSGYIEQIAKAVRVLFHNPSEAVSATIEPSTSDAEIIFGMPQGDKVVMGGRSIYYSALAYSGWVSSIWLPVFIQGLALSWLVIRLFVRMAKTIWVPASLLTLAALAVLTPASFFTGLVMPDIWAGLMILALALLWGGGTPLSSAEKALAFMILAFAALTHNSHLALLFVGIIVFVVALFFFQIQQRPTWSALIIPTLALSIGVAGQAAFSAVVSGVYGAPPLMRPHITAHLIDLGPGTRFAQDTCPDSDFAICGFVDRLPVDWISFMFDQQEGTGVFAVAPPDVQKALSAEQGAFALATLRAEPLRTLVGLAQDGAMQLWTLSVDDVPMTRDSDGYLERNFPSDLVRMTRDTFLYKFPDVVPKITWMIQTVSAASALALLVGMAFTIRTSGSSSHPVPPSAKILKSVVVICLIGMVINAAICGILASPYGRFQARVVWILPLLVALVTAMHWSLRADATKLRMKGARIDEF